MVSGHERDRDPFFVGRHPTGAADTVDVVVVVLRDVVVHDVGNSADVDPAADDVGGNQQPDFSLTELLHHPVACHLRQVAVHHGDVGKFAGDSAVKLLGSPFRSGEDQRLRRAFFRQQPNKQLEFAVIVYGRVILVDRIMRRDAVLRQIDPLWIPHISEGEPFDGCRKRGRKQHRLPIFRATAQDFLNVRPEADIEHAVGFIQHDDFDSAKIEHTALHQIDHPPGGSDDDLRTPFDVIDLLANRTPADDHRATAFMIRRKLPRLVCHLFTQLARGGENQHLRKARFAVDALNDGQDECSRLPRPGAGLSNAVGPGQGHRNKRILNGAGGVILDLVESFQRP